MRTTLKTQRAAAAATAELFIQPSTPTVQPVVLQPAQVEYIKLRDLDRKSYEALWSNLLWLRELLS